MDDLHEMLKTLDLDIQRLKRGFGANELRHHDTDALQSAWDISRSSDWLGQWGGHIGRKRTGSKSNSREMDAVLESRLVKYVEFPRHIAQGPRPCQSSPSRVVRGP